jgi:hypothetical protein
MSIDISVTTALIGVIGIFIGYIIRYILELRKIKSESLIQRRVDIMKDLYEKIVDAERIVGAYTSIAKIYYGTDIPTDEQKISREKKEFIDAMDVINELKFIQQNKIWFSKKTLDKLDRFYTLLYESILYKQAAKMYQSDEKKYDMLLKADKILRENVKNIKKDIEDEFRKILGV